MKEKAERKEQSQEQAREEFMKQYQAYAERVAKELNSGKKVGVYYIKEIEPDILTDMSIVFWKFIKIFLLDYGGKGNTEKQKRSGNMGFQSFRDRSIIPMEEENLLIRGIMRIRKKLKLQMLMVRYLLEVSCVLWILMKMAWMKMI